MEIKMKYIITFVSTILFFVFLWGGSYILCQDGKHWYDFPTAVTMILGLYVAGAGIVIPLMMKTK
jgi:hypothetical protein